VIAGPGGGVDLDPALLGGAMRTVADTRPITAGLAAVGYHDRRKRVLTAPVVVAVILGLCLFRRESYDLVIGRVLADVPRVRVEGPPTGPALSKARGRLDERVMGAVFSHAAATMPTPGPECYAFGLLVTAFDGTVFDLAATGDIQAAYATPSKGRFPQVRMAALVVCGLRWVLAARLGCCSTSEQALADQLADQVAPGTLNLADRGWFSMDRWIRCSAGGGHLAWRVKKTAPAAYPPGSCGSCLTGPRWCGCASPTPCFLAGEPSSATAARTGCRTPWPGWSSAPCSSATTSGESAPAGFGS
jgi:hypothetical protein